MFDLGGRAALVTGSTRGLGLAIARALAGAGARVAINGRSAEACERAAAGMRGAIAAPFDVTDEAAVAEGIERLAMVDMLVNNAGMTRRKPLEEWTLADWEELFDLNVTGAFLVSRSVVPGMIERGRGKIVNICSVQSELARPTIAAYTASKGAVRNLTRGMCADWARYGIEINAIAPG
jgi:gluconate 5-dehydrogenase